MSSKSLLSILLLCFFSTHSYADCFFEVAKNINIDGGILISIAKQESGLNPKAINHNKNGSRDVGLMQINSKWFDYLKKKGISETDLYDPCTSIKVAGLVLEENFKLYGRTWKAIGAYNTGTGKKKMHVRRRKKYASLIYENYYKYRRGKL